ncbi:MAG TPA: FAD-dependent oxidoreductase, partial [Mycobacteriales bacterium]|nr:FAD-dependent oxidoreductase [Mycobacteriales bacterium]
MATSPTVLGAGVAGLSAALMLARDGHRVRLLERDQWDVGAAGDAPTWPRPGISHFLQPHQFIPRGRVELRTQLPDVYDDLLSAGAYDVDLRRKLPGPSIPADEELQYLAVRRPVIEWALRRAVSAEPRIEVRAGIRVTGLRVDHGRVTGLDIGGTELPVDLVVDALGRRTPTADWLTEAGGTGDAVETSDCGVVYYSRYYRCRPGFELPDGPWLLSPRGDLGYLGFASFPGDNGTFAGLLSVPAGVPEWRVVKDAPAFEAAVARIPQLRQWVDPDGVEPITGVLPMAGLRNSLRRYDATSARGLVPVGDAFGHTDPVMAHGMAFALVHASELVAALREHGDVDDALSAYAASTAPAL